MGKSRPKKVYKEKSDDLSKNHDVKLRYRVRKQMEQEKEQELKQFLKEQNAGTTIQDWVCRNNF